MSILVNKPASVSADSTTSLELNKTDLQAKLVALGAGAYWEDQSTWKGVAFLFENASKQKIIAVFDIAAGVTADLTLSEYFVDGDLECLRIDVLGFANDFYTIYRSEFDTASEFDIEVTNGYNPNTGTSIVILDSFFEDSTSNVQLNVLNGGIGTQEENGYTKVTSPLQRFTMTGASISQATFKYSKTENAEIPVTAFYDAVVYKLYGNVLDSMTDSPSPTNTNVPACVSDPVYISGVELGSDKNLVFTFNNENLETGEDYAIALRLYIPSAELTFDSGMSTRIFLPEISGRANYPTILYNGNYYLSSTFAAISSYPYLKLKIEGLT